MQDSDFQKSVVDSVRAYAEIVLQESKEMIEEVANGVDGIPMLVTVVRSMIGDDDELVRDVYVIGPGPRGFITKSLEEIGRSSRPDHEEYRGYPIIFVLVSEGWAVALKNGETIDCDPSEHENRQEAIAIHVSTIGGDVLTSGRFFSRDENDKIVLGEDMIVSKWDVEENPECIGIGRYFWLGVGQPQSSNN